MIQAFYLVNILKMKSEEIAKKIRQISDGIPIKLGNITIRASDSEKLLVTGWTNTIHFENISKLHLLQELEDLKSSFSVLLKSFDVLNDVIIRNNFIVEYHIAFDDAGKVGIGLCSEVNDEITWYFHV